MRLSQQLLEPTNVTLIAVRLHLFDSLYLLPFLHYGSILRCVYLCLGFSFNGNCQLTRAYSKFRLAISHVWKVLSKRLLFYLHSTPLVSLELFLDDGKSRLATLPMLQLSITLLFRLVGTHYLPMAGRGYRSTMCILVQNFILRPKPNLFRSLSASAVPPS